MIMQEQSSQEAPIESVNNVDSQEAVRDVENEGEDYEAGASPVSSRI